MSSSKSIVLLSMMILALAFLPQAYASPVVVSINPTTQTVNQGSVASYAINLASAAKTAYRLHLSGLVTGAVYSFSSNPVSTPPGGGSGSGTSTLSLDATSLPLYCPGTYSFTVSATNSTSAPTPSDPGDSSSASATLQVFQVGPPLVVTVSTDKSAYRVGDKITIAVGSNRPAQGRLTISPPSSSAPTQFDVIFYGPSFSITKTLAASTIGHWNIYFQANDFCAGFNSAAASFDVSPDTYDVSISLDGIPAQYSAQVNVDNQPQGTIGGGEIKRLTFKLDTTHTIGVDQYVQGDTGVRYFASQNTWTVSSAGSYTFEYDTQYLFTVSTDPVGITDVTGGDWYKAGTTVQTNEVPATVPGAAGTQYAFKGWEVNGAAQSGNGISLVMDKPYNSVAKYVTQYQLVVDSPYGSPTGQGYYDAGSTAPFSVTTPSGFPVQQNFVRWEGDYTGTDPSGSVTMDNPKVVHAVWSTSYLFLILLGVVGVAVIAGLLFLTRRRRRSTVTETKSVPAEETATSAAAATAAGGVKCESCGTDNPSDQKFCTNCGKKLTQSKKRQT